MVSHAIATANHRMQQAYNLLSPPLDNFKDEKVLAYKDLKQKQIARELEQRLEI
jgi:hypothetical protein